jgi:hypothetical protein
MSLDISIYREIHHLNITHNLTKMANNIPAGDGRTLYDVMWCAEEKHLNYTEDLVDYLDVALRYMIHNREKLEKYNPDNGWGSYDGLLETVDEYYRICKDNPGCYISLCR